jgi:hypothetical protein
VSVPRRGCPDRFFKNFFCRGGAYNVNKQVVRPFLVARLAMMDHFPAIIIMLANRIRVSRRGTQVLSLLKNEARDALLFLFFVSPKITPFVVFHHRPE